MEETLPLTAAHKTARIAWASEKMTRQQDWKRGIFSDEKKFNLDGPDGYRHYWHDLRRPVRQAMRRQQGGGSVMVWGAISWEGKSELAVLVGRQASSDYVYTLSEFLLPFAHLHYGVDFDFQQDNAAIHTSRETAMFFDEMEIGVMDWPARSPDLNPIENVWALLSRRVYEGGRQYNTVADLTTAIQAAWKSISCDEIRNLITWMPRRCVEVITKKGDKTHY
ncbi:hypothetical protein ATCC90586_011240 [Pythium insidiosum]|nr:hypothetical protein ATCC90586_011240 [Pythium insidiosum]